MDRRKFIKQAAIVGAATPFLINGIPMKALSNTSFFNKVLNKADNNGNIMVLIQLHGGNDGLNTFVPLNMYDEYYNIRANVALPVNGKRKLIKLDENISDKQQLGLHPDIFNFKKMYDEASAAVVQNVGYENMNMSHFRSRDIYFMGGDYNSNYRSGWIGRWLNHDYPGYPNNYPSTEYPDPLALELGNTNSLAFHRELGIPIGLSIANPQAFYDLINGVGGELPINFPDSYYGDELAFLMNMENKAMSYAERLKYLYDNGSNSSGVIYPERYLLSAPENNMHNPLSEQLKILSRLISGGSTTQVYIIRIGGFDTHADQVEAYDNTMGRHSALLYHLTSAVKAFYDDLKAQGLDEKVVTMTFSEFGRRVYSNASYGTDHGKAQPVMLFGPGLKGGVYGDNADLNDLDRGNLKWKIDYRQIYTSVLQDWLGASDAALAAVYFDGFVDDKLDLFGLSKNNKNKNPDSHKLYDCYPNPAKSTLTLSYFLIEDVAVSLQIRNEKGNVVKNIISLKNTKGKHEIITDISALRSGIYYYTFKAGKIKYVKKLIKI